MANYRQAELQKLAARIEEPVSLDAAIDTAISLAPPEHDIDNVWQALVSMLLLVQKPKAKQRNIAVRVVNLRGEWFIRIHNGAYVRTFAPLPKDEAIAKAEGIAKRYGVNVTIMEIANEQTRQDQNPR